MTSSIPNLQFDVGALLRSDSFGSILNSKGGLPIGGKLIFGVADENIGFAHCTHADKDDFEHVIILFLFLGHFLYYVSESYKQKDLGG